MYHYITTVIPIYLNLTFATGKNFWRDELSNPVKHEIVFRKKSKALIIPNAI